METAQSVGFNRGQIFRKDGRLIYIAKTRNERVYWYHIGEARYPLQQSTTSKTRNWEPVSGVWEFWGKRAS